MSNEAWLAILGGAGTVLTAAAAAVVTVLSWRARVTRERGRDVLDQWREYADRLASDLALLRRQVDVDHRVMSLLFEAHGESEVEAADLYGELVRFNDSLRACANCIKRLGQDPGVLPPMPGRRTRRNVREEVDFLMRTARQDAAQVRAVDDRVRGPRTRPEGTAEGKS